METVACKALKAFTQFVPDYGQVHGDPESTLKEAKTPLVPVSMVEAFADQGFVALAKGFVTAAEAAADAEAEAAADAGDSGDAGAPPAP